MKYLTFILFVFPLLSNAQDCKAVNSLQSYHGLKFGEKIPDSIKRNFAKEETYLFLERKEIEKKGLSSLLKFFKLTTQFDNYSNLALVCDSDDKFYSLELWQHFDFVDSIEASEGNYPTKFNRAYKELLYLFGKESRIEKESEPVMNEIFGNKIKLVWDCDLVKITLEMAYGAKSQKMNNVSISITNVPLEKKEKLKRLQN